MKVRRRAITISAAVALVGVLAGCGAAAPSSPSSPESSPLVATATKGPIVVTLTLEGPPRNDADSWASSRIENTGDGFVRWAGGGCGEAGGIVIDALADV